jgi:hypothetical protein
MIENAKEKTSLVTSVPYLASGNTTTNKTISAQFVVIARHWVRLLLGVVMVAPFGCQPDEGPPASKETHIVVTNLGATCGNWQTEPSGTSNAARIYASCGDGLVCGHLESSRPPLELGNNFGICMPATGYACDSAYATFCSEEPLVCITQVGAPNGLCFYECQQHSDCIGPNQVCYSGGCRIMPCENAANGGVDKCEYLSHCDMDLGVCVPN